MYIFTSPRLKERRQGFDQLKEILKDKVKCYIIHYSCESFITSHGRTQRITSICIRNLKTAQTTSFSIHLQAQIEGKDFNNLSTVEYDKLEREMLKDFCAFVKRNNSCKWIHWNMRDSNYGFEALNNRIKILGGQKFLIIDDFKFDFPIILGMIFTYGYEKNRPNGRLLNLAERNGITTQDAITGAEEAKAFDDKEYLKLHMSTLKKVDIINSIIHRVENDELKVCSNKKEIYGLTLPGISLLIKNTPWLLFLTSIIGYFLIATFELIIHRFWGSNS